MIRRIQALNYRCLRYINQELEDFQILVGPNASGKSTFLDVVEFLGDLVSDGLDAAITKRTRNFKDLLWNREGDRFELAVELQIPDIYQKTITNGEFDLVRYEIAVGLSEDFEEHVIIEEKVLLKKWKRLMRKKNRTRLFFPVEPSPRKSILTSRSKTTRIKTIMSKLSGGNDNFYSETDSPGKNSWKHSFKFGPSKSILGNLPYDESKWPISTWLKKLLSEGLQKVLLNSISLRNASPTGKLKNNIISDGSNLPWVIEYLKNQDEAGFKDWIAHLRTAFPDIKTIRTVERRDDRHRYLKIRYANGLEVPSWMVSDGTLRLLALTLPIYLPGFSGIYLIEEPENGIHPGAIEPLFQSLSSAYDAQVLLATHSPVILSLAKAEQILCFSKAPSGAVDIVRGSEHPNLRDWHGEVNLSVLFAGGVLG